MSDVGGWWSEASTGAAREFGARHYRAFAAVAILRRIGPALGGVLAAAALLVAGRLAWQRWAQPATHAAQSTSAPDLAPLALPAALVVGLVVLGALAALAVRRWGTYLRMYWPVEHAAVWLWCLVMLAGGGAAAAVWLA
jgi:hypothetical protein